MLQIQVVNAKIDNDFDNPLGLLSDCHRRIEMFLDRLILVSEQVRGAELSPDQRETLASALRYFRLAAPLHTADEETSLFPRLRTLAEAGDPKARQTLATVGRLEADHEAADARHGEIDRLGSRWLDQGTLPVAEAARLESEVRNLRSFYAAHIAVEDKQLFPLAGEILDGDEVEVLGREMAARRGLDFDNLPAGSRCAARRAAMMK